MVCRFGEFPAVRTIVESAHFDGCAVVENCRIDLRPIASSGRTSSNFCLARGIWRHGYRRDGYARGLAACYCQPSQQLHSLASAWHYRFSRGRQPGHYRPFARSERTFHGCRDWAALKPSSDVPGAAVHDLSCDLHRPGKGLENRFGQHWSDLQTHAASCSLAIGSYSLGPLEADEIVVAIEEDEGIAARK